MACIARATGRRRGIGGVSLLDAISTDLTSGLTRNPVHVLIRHSVVYKRTESAKAYKI